MKFHWFHLMPYRFLPEDFSSTYRSVWVDIPSHLYDPAKGNQLYNEFLDELEFADQLGFDGVCCNEHHQNGYGLMPSPNLIAAALTRRTQNAAIVVMGNSLALYNPPIRVAEEFAMLDCMSGGRLVAGFPVGTSMDTNFGYGMTPVTLRERYHEAHDLIIKAWTEPEVFDFNGKYTQLRYVNIWPRPLQKPHPPVWIPGGGSIETWEWTTQMQYVYAYLSYSGWMRGKAVMDGYWRKIEELGGDDNPYHAGFLQLVCVSESEEQAEKDYAKHVEYFYDKCLHVWGGFADAPGYRTIRTLQAGFGAQVGQAATQARKGLTWKDLVEGGYVVAGSPQQVIDKMSTVIEGLRVGQLMLLMQIGSMPPELVRKNTELFAREVMPHLRGFWSNYEDRWYPKPLAQRARPAPVGAK
jgi:alkanesulfonate monooxygenase SsuD/methylene tetrahydromethanopterin reductase-like flavin-dependent oxidoreductase (luciferase family)